MKQRYDDSVWGEPFRPVFLPPRSQIEKSVLFLVGLFRETDFDLTNLEAGGFKSALSVQFAGKKEYEDVWSGGLFVSQEEIDRVRTKGVPIRRGVVTYIEDPKPKPECARW